MPYLARTIRPALDPLYLSEVKMHAHVDLDDEDPVIVRYIEAATDLVEEMAGKRLVSQTWKQTQGLAAGTSCVELTVHPVQSITAIQYLDADQVEQSATVGDFNLYSDENRATLVPSHGNSWPAMFDRPDTLRITFLTGFAALYDIPPALVQAVALLTAHYIEHRSAVGDPRAELPFGVTELVNVHRRGWIVA